MTKIGMAVLVGMMIMSLAGLIVCSVKQNKGNGLPRRCAPRNDKGARLPTLPGEPVKFRTAEMRFVECKAESDLSHYQEEREVMGQRAMMYEKRELAYLLADQLLASDGIAFREENGVLRAELKAVLPG